MSPTPFSFLSITAVLSSIICGLYGIYLVLFGLAMWATYRRPSKPRAAEAQRAYSSNAILRVLTVAMFIDLMAHFIAQAMEFDRARHLDAVDDQLYWSMPYIVVEGLTTAVAGLISDGLLVWRAYAICGRKMWMLYLWTSVTAASFCLAVAANLLPLAIFRDTPLCIIKFRSLSSVLMVVWGLAVLTMQTILTGHILYRVLICSLQRNTVSLSSHAARAYTALLSALIESCVVTWVGLFTYELASFVPRGRLTAELDIGYVMRRILPIFFGLSQCLVTVHVGFVDIISPFVQTYEDQLNQSGEFHELTTTFDSPSRERSSNRDASVDPISVLPEESNV